MPHEVEGKYSQARIARPLEEDGVIDPEAIEGSFDQSAAEKSQKSKEGGRITKENTRSVYPVSGKQIS